MSVDNMRPLRLKPEFREDPVNDLLVFQKLVIGVFHLPVRFLFCQKIPLKGGHLIFPEQRRILAEPDIPHQIPALFALLLIHSHKALADIIVQNVVERPAFIALSVNFHLLQRTVLIERYAAVV